MKRVSKVNTYKLTGLVPCSGCKELKMITAFTPCKRYPLKVDPYCHTCTAAKKRERYSRNPEIGRRQAAKDQQKKLAYINSYKVGGCRDCGLKYPPSFMHFHHIDPTNKTFSVSQGRCLSYYQIDAEIVKCELLCYWCHYIREYGAPCCKVNYA